LESPFCGGEGREFVASVVVGPLPVPYYDDGLITIFCGDCRAIVPLLPKFDLLLTDPPYGINVARKGTVGTSATETSKRTGWNAPCTKFEPVKWDKEAPPPWILHMLIGHAKQSILWGGNFYKDLDRASCWLVWDKVNGKTSFADCELAWTNMKKAVRLFRWRWNGMLQQDMKNKEKRVHPTQKPVPLMEWCIGHAKEPRMILDPYMGSGSTLVAAHRLGICAVGIDIHEPYCAAAVQRLRDDRANAQGDSREGARE
jgi:site-specific DNA-methyltransferase (adenine-specific)